MSCVTNRAKIAFNTNPENLFVILTGQINFSKVYSLQFYCFGLNNNLITVHFPSGGDCSY